MNVWLVLIPLVSAVIGWGISAILVNRLFYPTEPKRIMGYSFQGILLKQQPELARKLAKLVSRELISFSEIEQKLLSAGSFKKIIPEVELQVDHFLAVKLKEKMPMVGMFVGERTLAQLKEIFMEELETLFPVIMKNYLSGLTADFDVERMIYEKLASSPAHKITGLSPLWSKQLSYLTYIGALIGFFVGALQILIILFFYS